MHKPLKRILVVYSGVSGATESVARRIAADLIGHHIKPTLAHVSENPVLTSEYDGVIFGSGVRFGKWHKEGQEWLNRSKDQMAKVPVAVFSVGLLGVRDQASKKEQAQNDLDKSVAHLKPIVPIEKAVFPGWKQSEGFSRMEQLALKVYPLEEGDYRDWNLVDQWVAQVAPQF